MSLSLHAGTRMAGGTNYEVSLLVRIGSDILAERTACAVLQLLSELHSWGQNSNLLLGLRAQGFSKLHLMASPSWKEERRWGEESTGRGRGGKGGAPSIGEPYTQLSYESKLPASQLTIRKHFLPDVPG